MSEAQAGWIQAEWLVLGAERILHPGWLRHAGGTIEAVGAGRAPEVALDFRGVVAPGCVNAHAHLDLSTLRAARAEGEPFEAWLQKLVRAKSARTELEARDDVRIGRERLLATGTTCVADIDASSAAPELAEGPLRAISLREVLGLDEAHLRERIDLAWTERRPTTAIFEQGLTPHAPYSTAAAELAGAARWLAAGAAVQMHVLETPEERRWCEREEGPFGDLLRAIGVPEERCRSWRRPPLDVLRDAGLLRPRFSIAHGNELRADEIEQLRRSGVGVVFCPGTHLAFGRERDALAALDAHGVPWGLGTDGWVTGQDLDLRAQARFGARIHPEIPAQRWFDAATRGGARVLHLPVGMLLPDLAADWVVYDGAERLRNEGELFDAWLAGALRVRETWIGGRPSAARAH